MTAVLGYKRCRCGAQVLNETAYATGGHCVNCWLGMTNEQRNYVELVIDGRTAKLSTRPSKTRENGRRYAKRKTDPQWVAKRAEVTQARRRAQRRVANMHRREYLEVYAAERAKAGLDPWPAVLAVEYRALCEAEGTTMSRSPTYDPVDAEPQDVEAAGESRAGTA